MSEAFVGEIRAFPYTFVPADWLPCDGRSLAISDYTPLFSVIGTAYGGDGRSTFFLPKLNGAAAMGGGAGPGLTPRQVGQTVGGSDVTLTIPQMPAHQHQVNGRSSAAASDLANMPTAGASLSRTVGQLDYPKAPINPWVVATGLSPVSVGTAGSGLPHENRQPALVLAMGICTNGIFPPKP